MFTILFTNFLRNNFFRNLPLIYMYWFAATYFHDKTYVINLQRMLKTFQKLVCGNKYSRRQGSRELHDIFSQAIKSFFYSILYKDSSNMMFPFPFYLSISVIHMLSSLPFIRMTNWSSFLPCLREFLFPVIQRTVLY